MKNGYLRVRGRCGEDQRKGAEFFFLDRKRGTKLKRMRAEQRFFFFPYLYPNLFYR